MEFEDRLERSVYFFAVSYGEYFDEPGFIVDTVDNSIIAAANSIIIRFPQFLCTNRPLLRLKGKNQFPNTALYRFWKFEVFFLSFLDDFNGVLRHKLFLSFEKISE